MALGLAAEELSDRQVACLTSSPAFDSHEAVCREILEAVPDPLEGTGNAVLDKAAGLGESDAQHPIHSALPFAQGVLCQQGAGLARNLHAGF